MQIYALSNGQLIEASRAQRQINYQCLECKKAVRLRKGLHKRAHFYHIDPTPSCRLNGKSLTHIALQLYIQNLFSLEKLKLEYPFPAINRIADCVHHEKKLIFEIQCSPIAEEEVQKRTADYNSLGFNVIWILHEKEFNKYRLTAAEQYLAQKFLYYTNMDDEGKGVIYDQRFIANGAYRIKRERSIPVDLRNINTSEIKTSKLKKFLYKLLKFFHKIKL